MPDIQNHSFCADQSLPLTRVLVFGGHLCEAEAPTEAAAETLTP